MKFKVVIEDHRLFYRTTLTVTDNRLPLCTRLFYFYSGEKREESEKKFEYVQDLLKDKDFIKKVDRVIQEDYEDRKLKNAQFRAKLLTPQFEVIKSVEIEV